MQKIRYQCLTGTFKFPDDPNAADVFPVVTCSIHSSRPHISAHIISQPFLTIPQSFVFQSTFSADPVQQFPL